MIANSTMPSVGDWRLSSLVICVGDEVATMGGYMTHGTFSFSSLFFSQSTFVQVLRLTERGVFLFFTLQTLSNLLVVLSGYRYAFSQLLFKF